MIGALRERVGLLYPVRTPDGGGGASITYENRREIHAATEDLRSGRDRSAERETRLLRRRFVIRRRDDILFETRLLHENKTFRITSIERRSGQKPLDVLLGEEVRS